jgi:hypothetical protein
VIKKSGLPVAPQDNHTLTLHVSTE